MPHADQIVLALLALGLPASILFQRRRGQRGRRLVVAAFALFYGHTLVTMLALHCADVLWGVTHRSMSMTGKPFAYDWRTYSLLLFGALLVAQGLGCMRAAARMSSDAPAARAEVLRRAALVLAIVLPIVLPIVPIHAFFGYLIGGATTLTLAVVAIAGRESPARTQAPIALPAV